MTDEQKQYYFRMYRMGAGIFGELTVSQLHTWHNAKKKLETMHQSRASKAKDESYIEFLNTISIFVHETNLLIANFKRQIQTMKAAEKNVQIEIMLDQQNNMLNEIAKLLKLNTDLILELNLFGVDTTDYEKRLID